MQEYTVRVYTSEDGAYPRTEWRQNGKLHRTDGPARECANGNTTWYRNDKLHRTDGPAIEYANGNKSWYIEGECYTEEEFNQKTTPACTTKTVIIDGVEYQLVKK